MNDNNLGFTIILPSVFLCNSASQFDSNVQVP